MYRSSNTRAKPPLNEESLRNIALHYVGKYSTTKSKLSSYLSRKIVERGWDGERPADILALVSQFVELQYVDDAQFAQSRARSFVRRGYGKGRLDQDLRAAGINDADASDAQDHMQEGGFAAAENFARRKRIGPFANETASPERRQKQLAAFLRAGHSFDMAKRFVYADPGEEVCGD